MWISTSTLAALARRALCGLVLAPVLALAACAGETPPENPRTCLHALYEACNTEHDCDSGVCYMFAAEGFLACTQTCDAANPCPPDIDGNPVACDANLCKPAEPVECVQ